MILYLRNWFPAGARARAVAWFMTANPLAGVIGGPISGALLGTASAWNCRMAVAVRYGRVPAILLALVVLATLKDHPSTSRLASFRREAVADGVP